VFGTGEVWVDRGWWETTYIPQTLGVLLIGGQITQSGLTVFLMYDTCTSLFLAGSPNCEAWGNHEDTLFNTPPQIVYSLYADYNDIIQTPAYPFTDVAVLSHEVAEWVDDPFHSNSTYCGGPLEVGDPLAWYPSSYYSYVSNGTTYHLQDLVFLRYFGANIDTSINDQWSFQNESLSICWNGH
jgi:hypothetical protein